LPGEIERIQGALRGEPQTRDADGTFSVMLPLRFRSGVGEPAVVELSRPNTPIATAAGPWRTNAIFLFAMLLLLAVATFGVARMLAVVAQAPAEARAQLAPRPTVAERSRRVEVPQPGIREEGEARRRAEDRAQAAEERLSVLQDQYRRALEELQQAQNAARDAQRPIVDQHLEERALRAEAEVQSLVRQLQTVTDGHERLQAQLRESMSAKTEAPDDGATTARLHEAEMEVLGLRAELEGTKERLAVTRREMEELQHEVEDGGQSGAAGAEGRRDLGDMHLELMRTKNALSIAESDLAGAKRSAEDAKTELRALRNEEQRATMLAEEVRAAKAEVESLRASHRAELVERDAEIEEKVRATREEFQRQVAEIEEAARTQIDRKESELAGRISDAESTASASSVELVSIRDELEAAQAEAADRERRLLEAMNELAGTKTEIGALQAEIQERTVAVGTARKEADDMRRSLVALQADLTGTDERVEGLRVELDAERARASEAAGFVVAADRDRASLTERVEELTRLLADATGENAEVNRRLQDFEARRQLELANDEGRAEIDDLLRVTQERLAGQTEKLITAEDRVKELEAEVAGSKQRVEILEGDLRTHQMSEALREMRSHEATDAPHEVHEGVVGDGPIEDRRATTPFVKELSLDAQKSLTRIIGLTQILKHKRDEKEQGQLLKQLATYAKRLDGTVHDLSNAERLVDGTIDLQIRKVDLEAVVRRIAEGSELGEDHEVRLVTEAVSLRVDPVRTEQIVATLLRNAGERAGNQQLVVVRLQSVDGGALISVEDPEPSSDASMSPVVKRLADIHGGWAKVEDSSSGGSAFQVFLPDASNRPPVPPPAETGPELQIVVDTPEPRPKPRPEPATEPAEEIWEAASAEQILSRELRRLAELSGGDDR
jgi:hypothetical protein